MKKRNAGDRSATDQRVAELKRARRIRRKAKREAVILTRLRPLLVRIGQLQQQLNELSAKQRREPENAKAATVAAEGAK
jgi:hypothetical protein